MIEPIQTERQCRKCLVCKPQSAYSRCAKGPGGFHSYCKQCRSAQNSARGRVVRAAKPPYKPMPRWEPLWAVPRHDLVEQLDCVRLRKWGGAEPNARFGVPSIGVAA